MQRTIGMLVVAGALVLGAGACSDDDGGSTIRADIVAKLTENGAFDEGTAGCIADAMIDEFGADKLASEFEDDSENMPPEVEAKLGEMVGSCMGVPTT